MQQHGIGSLALDQDADDILALARNLREEDACDECILAGHSTGMQDATWQGMGLTHTARRHSRWPSCSLWYAHIPTHSNRRQVNNSYHFGDV
jgi:hypothetical protein